ncbi:hypothetical protein F5879DRAFT_874239 [Lentinula edodes]|uniref:DUF7702 domain-containing protein n=1 Tax=Lentinula edodes TaxID=5353 RepID=A0A1Q3E2D5_LENED|nr:hypothetical protein F5051DRAFT_397847 [Lentinula edodes]KAJ3908156.1 hypothetical protein F5879DRAFT_874239 [Lentinula edodes]KAJ3918626.1 hypothetical protein F5877DRAFT_42199 [Lentinula edodes]GAW01405.1 hypothetical protein LENED_002999 [Lentinula edodes]
MPPSLDIRGDIAAAQLAFYAPIAIITFFLTVRHAFEKDAGFFFLFFFSIIRITGGALIIAAELVQPSVLDLFIAAYILFPVGLAFLMLAFLGFLGLAGQHTVSEYRRTMYLLRLIAFIAVVALALSIAGGLLGTHINPDAHTGLILRRVAAGIYGGTFVLLVGATFMSWSYSYLMRSYRRNLLGGLTLALLPLGVRAAYAILDAWSSSDIFGSEPSSNSTLAQLNPITGNFIFYLILGLVMEYIVALICLFFSTIGMQRRHRRHRY